MSRTHLPPLMECPPYTALGRGKENINLPCSIFFISHGLRLGSLTSIFNSFWFFSSHKFRPNDQKKAYLNFSDARE